MSGGHREGQCRGREGHEGLDQVPAGDHQVQGGDRGDVQEDRGDVQEGHDAVGREEPEPRFLAVPAQSGLCNAAFA